VIALDVRLWIALVCYAAAFLLLGYRVARGPAAWPDSLAPRVFGRATRAAVVFTVSGYARAIGAACTIAVIVALAEHALAAAAVIVLTQIVSQLAVAAIKALYDRARPANWLFRKEPGSSYPSGHATTAVAFYGTWLWLASHSALPEPLKTLLVAALAVWIVGICWSRIALGAHYPTDVLGGVLIGAAFLSLEMLLLLHVGIT
jgi:membrane-associated phospholipid phosphatase